LRQNAIGLGNPETFDPKKAKVAATALTAWPNKGNERHMERVKRLER